MRTQAGIVPLSTAVADLVHDGDTVALEGFTHLIPVAAGHEMIRQRRRDLTLVRMTPDIVYDQLIGAGCARKLVFSWGGNPGVGSLHRFRDAIQNAWPEPLEIEEHSHAGLANRYVAGASGLPFAVMRGYRGTDLPEHTATIAPITCPFTGEQLTAVPALEPDVAIVHAQRADREGNVQMWGLTGVQKEAVLGGQALARHGRGDRRRARPAPERGRAAELGRDLRGGGAQRRAPVLRPRLLRARQRLLPRVGRDQQGPQRLRRLAGGAARRGAGMSWTTDEMMSVAAARALPDGAACFVGIGLPSTAANLARRTHAPGLVLIYEAGAIGAKPTRLPMSIGDGILAETADAVVSVPEVFNYWLQPGRIDVGFLGAAQIDRFANINTTVIGDDYRHPKVRLPGAGGAPEIAASCGEVVVIVRQTTRSFVEQVDFVTSVGFGSGPGDRERLGLRGRGPVRVITDLGVLEPDPETCELTLTAVHPGVDVEQARAATGWDLAVADDLQTSAEPTDEELAALRELEASVAPA